MKDLENNSLVDGKLGNNVSKEQVSVVFGGRVHTLLGQETRPSKGHETPELGSLSFVVGVMDVGGCVLHQQGGKLEQEDAHRVL